MAKPVVTVLMPVRNGAKHLRAAISSILSQSYRDFEFLVLDDGSTDETPAILRSFRDSRLRVETNPASLGVARTLNRGLDLACGDLIARMDADDISRPRRLAEQVTYMTGHPEVAVLGTAVRFFGALPFVPVHGPEQPEVARAFALYDNPLFHPTVMIRKSVLDRAGLRYDPSFTSSEDFALWLKVLGGSAIANLPRVLVWLRVHRTNVTRTQTTPMFEQTRQMLADQLAKLDIQPDAESLEFHRRVGHGDRMESVEAMNRAEAWLSRLADANRRSAHYTEQEFRSALGLVWRRLCLNSSNLGMEAWRRLHANPWKIRVAVSSEEQLRFVLGVVRNTLVRR